MHRELSFRHRFVPAPTGASTEELNPLTLLLLHGTGGSENDLIELGRTLCPTANLLGVRGQVLENGRPRFFRRLAEGVFDIDDLIFRTHELADFAAEAAAAYEFDVGRVIAAGYSNGANIAASMLLLRPSVLAAAILLRAMTPLEPETEPNLDGVPILLAAGKFDPIVPPDNVDRLAEMLRSFGAEVTLRRQNASHELAQEEIVAAQQWLAAHVR